MSFDLQFRTPADPFTNDSALAILAGQMATRRLYLRLLAALVAGMALGMVCGLIFRAIFMTW